VPEHDLIMSFLESKESGEKKDGRLFWQYMFTGEKEFANK